LYLSGAVAHHNVATVSTAIQVTDCVRQKQYATILLPAVWRWRNIKQGSRNSTLHV